MELSPKNIKMWSKIGTRATYGLAVMDLALKREKLLVLTSDTSTSAGLDRFKKKFPNRYFDLGIAEQNTLGVAAGLASEGFIVFASTFAPFQTMRCMEQIKVNLAYMRTPVNITGLASGVALGHLGYTHCCIEDIAIMRSLPNMVVLSPADSIETAKAVYASADINSPVYIRLTGDNSSANIYTEDYNFQIGKSIKLIDGDDIALLATGTMVSNSIDAARELNNKNISVSVYNFHTIKPLDTESLKNIFSKYKLVISIEEHNVIGGLGSAISEEISSYNKLKAPLLKLGIPDTYNHTGEYREVLDKVGLNSKGIFQNILKRLEKL